jgi:hypothetical protein
VTILFVFARAHLCTSLTFSRDHVYSEGTDWQHHQTVSSLQPVKFFIDLEIYNLIFGNTLLKMKFSAAALTVCLATAAAFT